MSRARVYRYELNEGRRDAAVEPENEHPPNIQT